MMIQRRNASTTIDLFSLVFILAFSPTTASDISVSNPGSLLEIIKVDPSFHVGSFSDTTRGCLDSVLSGCIELQEHNIVRGVMSLDVSLAFNLKDEYGIYSDEYDTLLKRKQFLSSQDGKTCLGIMKSVRDSILSGKIFFIKATGNFSSYSLQSHGISLIFDGSNCPIKRAISYVYFPTILSKLVLSSEPESSGPTPRDSSASFFLKIDEVKGRLVEDGRENVAVYILFKITGSMKQSHRDFDERGKWHTRAEAVITSLPMSIVVGNIDSHECYAVKFF